MEQKSNEIKAIPILLEQLDLKGAIVTIDAMGTQTAIAQQIQDSGADYILTLKANHPTLAEDARGWFEQHQDETDDTPVNIVESVCEAGHHRIEKRRFCAVSANRVFDPKRIKQWRGLKTLIVEQSSPKGYIMPLWYRFAYGTASHIASFGIRLLIAQDFFSVLSNLILQISLIQFVAIGEWKTSCIGVSM